MQFQVLGIKYFERIHNDTFTKPIRAGTSTSGPITAANACPELMPNTATATAIANSKLLTKKYLQHAGVSVPVVYAKYKNANKAKKNAFLSFI